jgi:hypothetical protein
VSSEKQARTAPRRALTPQGGAISGGLAKGTGAPTAACECCARPFEPRPNRRFCSPACRLLAWAAAELLERYLAGTVPGLQPIIEQMGRRP